MPPESSAPIDVSVSPPPASQILEGAFYRLVLVADGKDVPGNLRAALMDVLKAAYRRDGEQLEPVLISACLASLDEAEDTVLAYCSASSCPSTVNLAFRSASSFMQLVGTPVDDWSDETRQLSLCWAEWICRLVSEIEATGSDHRAARVAENPNDEPAAKPQRLH